MESNFLENSEWFQKIRVKILSMKTMNVEFNNNLTRKYPTIIYF